MEITDIQYKKHNAYIKIFQVKQQLSLQQHRIFDALIILLQEKKEYTLEDIQKEKELVFDLEDFKTHLMHNLKIKKINKNELKSSVEELVKITLAFDTETETEDKIELYPIFQYANVDFKNSKISFIFSRKFSADYMLPTSKYTLLSAKYINRLKKVYSRLLYQHFKMLIGTDNFRNNIKLTPDFIRNLLGLQESKSYKISSQITNKIIIPTIKEISEETDIIITCEVIKSGRNLLHYYFEFTLKDDKTSNYQQKTLLLDDDHVYNPSVFDNEENVIETEIIPIDNNKQGYISLSEDEDKFENIEKFREYLIINAIGKIMPPINMPNGKIVEIEINSEGKLVYASKKQLLSAPLAKYIWSALFFMQKDIVNNIDSLKSSKSAKLPNSMNIFDFYEKE